MASEGLLRWANTIRLTMALDPGRQLFRDQVQAHGFSFLNDYLDSILSNAKQDALIDLVKTPGRKRIVGQKIKPVLKHKDGITLFPKDGELNYPQGMDRKSLFESPNIVQQEVLDKPREVEDVQVTRNVMSSVPPASASTGTLEANSFCMPHTESNQLSIIAEDDETAEKSRLSSPLCMVGMELQDEAMTPQPDDVQVSTSCQLHRESTSSGHQDPATATAHSLLDQIHNTNEQGTNEEGNDPPCRNNDLSPLIDASTNNFRQDHEVMDTQIVVDDTILPTGDNRDAVDLFVPLHDIESPPASPKDHNISFPSLPAPAPLRKSMRAVGDNNSTQVNLGTVTPGAAITGKRTSWLQKARQAKALEIAGKKTTASLSSASLLQASASSLAHVKRKSAEVFNGPGEGDNGRHHKIAKTMDGDVAVIAERPVEPATERFTPPLPLGTEQTETRRLDEEGMIDFLKKAVEGFGARAAGKSAGKSLGVSAAASGLAEARAAAEARIAERNMNEKEPMGILYDGKPEGSRVMTEELASAGQTLTVEHKPVQGTTHRELNIAHLNSAASVVSTKHMKVFQPQLPCSAEEAGDAKRLGHQSATMTPPGTPSVNKNPFIPPSGPVFNKPPAVFKPPKQLTLPHEIPKPTAMRVRSSPTGPGLAAQSTLESIRSEVIFDEDKDTPAWMTGTQETSYTTAQMDSQDPNICDEDDSWPIDEKLSEGVQWICANAKDDSTTWSSLASHHNTASEEVTQSRPRAEQESTENIGYFPDAYESDVEGRGVNFQDAGESDLDDDIAETAKNTVRLVDPPRSRSQLSQSSSTSSQQSNVGFFSQASKLITSLTGSSKKPKSDVKKVLQKAAVAAKKQQEESDRKVARLREMDNRRQLAQQRKAEEERTKIEEQERKVKEENERRKREREEHTDKRPLKAAPSRKDEEAMKKRKIEVEKKAEIKNPINLPKTAIKSGLKQPSALSSFAAYNSSLNATTALAPGANPELKSNTPLAASSKGKGKEPTKPSPMEDDIPQPSQIVQTQMAARAKAQLQAAKLTNEPPAIPSESIELPDINSEYSDSEDEDRKRTFDPPDWAQSPELRQALQQQSTVNPDDIFGPIRPLKMEELFKKRTSRFRARTSSANWAGADRLTVEEEREYARRMGFK